MKTFDLMTVQRDLYEQLKASKSVYDIIDQLHALADEIQDDAIRGKVHAAARELAETNAKIVNRAASSSEKIVEFLG